MQNAILLDSRLQRDDEKYVQMKYLDLMGVPFSDISNLSDLGDSLVKSNADTAIIKPKYVSVETLVSKKCKMALRYINRNIEGKNAWPY